jgi:hypothetical protein
VESDPRLIITVGGGASQKVTLRCPPGGNQGLADTGVSGGASLGVLTGLAALTTGNLLLVRRRPSRS